MKWFTDVFLRSFETGKEIQITEKQFLIFEKYLKESKDIGYTYNLYGTVNNLKIHVYEWACVGKHRYYAIIEEMI